MMRSSSTRGAFFSQGREFLCAGQVAIFPRAGNNLVPRWEQSALGKRAGDLPVVSGPSATTKRAVRYD